MPFLRFKRSLSSRKFLIRPPRNNSPLSPPGDVCCDGTRVISTSSVNFTPARVIGRASILTAGHGSLAVTPGYQFPVTLQKLFVTRKSHLLRACKNCRAGLVESLYDVVNIAVAPFRTPECQAAGNLQPDNSQQLMFGTLRVFVMAFTAVSTAHTGDVFSSCTHIRGQPARDGGLNAGRIFRLHRWCPPPAGDYAPRGTTV
ncbi:hypothetical protein Bbelb_006330 [Branchiostoma belcheri]|nr:hypothetical protein Bbelb_006330 [Branchiostoma belcheri]